MIFHRPILCTFWHACRKPSVEKGSCTEATYPIGSRHLIAMVRNCSSSFFVGWYYSHMYKCRCLSAYQRRKKFRYKIINGVSINVLFICLGALIATHNDIRNHKKWFGHQYSAGDILILKLEEPLVEKANSYKALALVKGFYKNNAFQKTKGSIILYFKKDSTLKSLGYGSQIITSHSIDLIRNSGNPGSFDYKKYSLFHGITHQVYLTESDYVLLPRKSQNAFLNFIFQSRSEIVSIIRQFIKGEKEQGLAEALLIGYKEDLDKNLVQAYSNTGVVHVIAISGLHLGLIYWLLLGFTKPLNRKKFFGHVFLLLQDAYGYSLCW